ncbi:hypothetical protein J132_09586, partial [Termitomyces sp. J132]
LGLHIDRKLTFNQHAQKIAQRASMMATGSRILANMIRGMNQTQLRTMYKACVLPIMTYTSPAWWTGKKAHVDRLTKIQNGSLHHMAGAFRTTPTKALEVDMSIPPLEVMMELTIGNYAN